MKINADLHTMPTDYVIEASEANQKIKELAIKQINLEKAINAISNTKMAIGDAQDSVKAILTRYKDDVKRNYIFKDPQDPSSYFALFQTVTGYLIFDPLSIPLPPPFGTGESFFPLVPNSVRLVRPDNDSMELWTGGAGGPMKLRFEYPLAGVSVEEFKQHWSESFYREMMTYPVLNRLDRERGVQYYYQKGNLVVRDAHGSHMEKVPEALRVEKLSEIFRLSPDLVEKALKILSK